MESYFEQHRERLLADVLEQIRARKNARPDPDPEAETAIGFLLYEALGYVPAIKEMAK